MTSSQITPTGMENGGVGMEQYLPEPSTTGYGAFGDVLQAASGIAGTAISAMSGVDISGFQQLLAAQMQAQMEMQQVSMISNVEKSRHESKMTPIRNIRVG